MGENDKLMTKWAIIEQKNFSYVRLNRPSLDINDFVVKSARLRNITNKPSKQKLSD